MNSIKKFLLIFVLFPPVFGCCKQSNTNDDQTSNGKEVLTLLNETRTTQYFSDEKVSTETITAILEAGRNAMSGRNMQSWYFGAIINPEIIKEIANTMSMPGPPPGATPESTQAPMPRPTSAFPKAGFKDAPAAIAIATDENNEFSAGLACQNMVIAANALGYGAKIVMGGAAELNSDENRNLLGTPENMNVIVILLVGKADTTIDMTADGVTGASTRKALSEVSKIIE